MQKIPFDLKALQIFVTVVEQKSMTKAASLLGLTQPAISLSVRALEQNLAIRLINRNIKPMQTTHAGHQLYHQAGQLLSHAQQVINTIDMEKTGKFPELRLGLVDSIATTIGPSLLQTLRIKVNKLLVLEGLGNRLLDKLRGGELDLILMMESDDCIDDNLIQIPLFNEPYLLALPPSYG